MTLIALTALLAVYSMSRFMRGTHKSQLLWQIGVFVVMFVLFVVWAPWISAVSREEALVRNPGMEIPAHWDAVVVGHGTPNHWHLGTVKENPIGFSLCVAAFIGCSIVLHRLTHKERIEAAGSSKAAKP